jgi:hypothetical protein
MTNMDIEEFQLKKLLHSIFGFALSLRCLKLNNYCVDNVHFTKDPITCINTTF